MLNRAKGLKPQISQYDLIVGDDTSGRLPARLYWRLANMRRQEQGMRPASLRFISGRNSGYLPEKGMLPIETSDAARALLVTEYICNGGNIRNIHKAVWAERVPGRIDIATLDQSYYSLGLERRFPKGTSLYCGTDPRHPLDQSYIMDDCAYYLYGDNYDRDKIKGVEKREGEPYAHRLPPDKFSGELVRQGREDIDLIAGQLYSLLPHPEA